MVDGVNFNPFTGKVLTTEEIQQLDLNKDGIVSNDELQQGMSWLAGGQDADGDVQIGEDSAVVKAAKNSGMTNSAEGETELRSNIAILQDEYIEHYFRANTGLSSEERSNVISLVSTATNSFVSLYLTEHPQGPYNMTDIASKYEVNLDETITNNKNARAQVTASVDGYLNNIDSNYSSLLDIVAKALGTDEGAHGADNYIKGTEWNQIKNKAVQYLMGSLMSDSVDVDLLKNINPNYAKNSNYIEAKKAIDELKNCSDPAKMQELLTTAQQKLAAFLEQAGSAKVADAIQDTEKAKQENAITADLNKQIDSWVENKITKDMSAEEKEVIQKFAEHAIGTFLDKLEKEGRLDSSNMKTLIAEFNMYIEGQYLKYTQIQDKMDVALSETESTYNKMVELSDSAKASGNVSNEEKAQIIDVASQLVVKQLLNDCDEIQLLAALNPNYKASADFVQLQSIVKQIKTSVDVDEIKKLGDDATALVKKILEQYSGNKLAEAVDMTKPVEISDDTHDKAIAASTIGSAYQANQSRTTGYGKQTQEALNQIKAQAEADIMAYAESLKAQLKAQLGAGYNEADIDKYIQDAKNDTIALFTQNVTRRNQHGNYTVSASEQAFVFARRSGTKKGRYVYNVQSLINTFKTKFNETAKAKHGAKLDPAQATYDKENVIADSVGDEYNRDTVVKNNDKTALRETAKAKLRAVAAAMQASLIAEGSKIPVSDIVNILDESVMETINAYDFDASDAKAKYDSKHSINNLVAYISQRNSFSTKDLIDDFMNRVDAKLDKLKGKKAEKSESEQK